MADPQVLPAERGDARRTLLVGVALGGAALTIGVVIISLLVWLARGMEAMPVSFGSSPVGVLGLVVSPICYAAVGAVLASRLPANPIGWLFLAMGMALGVMLPVNLLVAAAHEALRPAAPSVVWLAWARTTFGTPIVLTAAVAAVQLFPDGRPLSGAWRLGPWVSAIGGALLLAATAVDPVGLITYPSIPNPLALPYSMRWVVAGLRMLAVALLLGSSAVAIGAIWYRHRHGAPVLRAQLRWIVAAVALMLVAAIPFVIARYLLRVSDPTGELLAAAAQIGACAFPLSAAMAISKYRLYDIDVVIGRSLVYLPLMAVLGGMYTSGIALFQRLFVAVTGSESDVAVVMTILVVASAFTPVRRALESFVDRRFAIPGEDRARPAPATRRPRVRRAPTAASTLRPPPPHVQIAAVDASGGVACPRGAGRTLRDCLGCPHLLAFVDHPSLGVVCTVAPPG